MDKNNIKKAYICAAQIVTRHGDKYLPIFSRLEKAHKDIEKQNKLLTKAMSIAKSYSADK